jgi:predicted anti-sigma-YlaC factor YlaD
MTDYYDVDCEQYREALSARLDDEESAVDAEQPTDLHVEYCVECALWYDTAALITRRTRTTAVVAWPDVTDAVLTKVPLEADRRFTRLRIALGVVGALQGTAALVALTGFGEDATPAGYETVAWRLALGVAFGAVATRRTPPAALVPLLGTLVAVLSWGHLTELIRGEPSLSSGLAHVLAIVGFVLVVLLRKMPPVHWGPPTPASGAGRLAHPAALDKSDIEPSPIMRLTGYTKSA